MKAKQEISLRELKIEFLLRKLSKDISRFSTRLSKVPKVLFLECRDDIRNSPKHIIRFQFERHECYHSTLRGWSFKAVFFCFILDINKSNYYDDKYLSHNVYTYIHKKYYGMRFWINSWRMVSLFGDCGSNYFRLLGFDTDKKVKLPKPLNYLRKVVVLQKIQEVEERYSSICSDPMCGCSEDFAEDGGRELRHLNSLYYSF